MPTKKEERTKKKIASIRGKLLAEKRKFGCFDDSYGRRYMPPTLHIDIGDYKGGLTYMRWFEKNFPDDIGMPDFLFEWTMLLFYAGKEKLARTKALQTYFSNAYLIDLYFSMPIFEKKEYESSNLSGVEFLNYFDYRATDERFEDFSVWLDALIRTPAFKSKQKEFSEIQKRLLDEEDQETRVYLLKRKRQLLSEYSQEIES